MHKNSVFACIKDEKEEIILEKRFGTLTPDLDNLRDVLVEHCVGRVVMESTSIYWMPVWRVLEPDFDLTLANPYLVKQLPGDKKDAKWLAKCMQKGLIGGSFVPDEDLQQLRQYSRGYHYLSQQIVRVEQRLDNHLQRCNIRISNYVSNQGKNKSIRKVLKAIQKGERDPAKLCRLIHGRIKNKHGQEVITSSLTGFITEVDVEMFRQCMEELELLEKQQAQCVKLLEESAMKHYAGEITMLCTIPGIQKLKKNGVSYFGYKNHVKQDAGSKIIVKYKTTDASVHDSQAIDDLLEKDKGEDFYADSAYTGESQENIISSKEMNNKVCEKGYRNRPSTDEQKAHNKEKSRVRSRVEHIFGFMEMSMNGMYIRELLKTPSFFSAFC